MNTYEDKAVDPALHELKTLADAERYIQSHTRLSRSEAKSMVSKAVKLIKSERDDTVSVLREFRATLH